MRPCFICVMAGLDPVIHENHVDHRDKPGDDEWG